MRISHRWIVSLLATVLSGVAWAQGGAPSETPSPNSISSSLGVSVYPAKGQTPATQEKDESQCFGWAQAQTHYNPFSQPGAPPTPPTFGPGHRIAEKEAQQAQQQQTAATRAQHAAFNQAFSSCMTGKGYSAK